ncbi:MAG TPA: hypothetical protein VGP82_09320 [Ktedonobacterales bacterium]|nr:hypothetical protein [Ktedonobacterales bacterium]
MARRIHRETKLSTDELERRYRAGGACAARPVAQLVAIWADPLAPGQGPDGDRHRRTYGLLAVLDRADCIAKCYNAKGPAGMVNRQCTTSWRAPRMLSAAQQEELR